MSEDEKPLETLTKAELIAEVQRLQADCSINEKPNHNSRPEPSETNQGDRYDNLETELNQLIDAVESMNAGFILYDANDRFVRCNSLHKNYYPHLNDVYQPGISRSVSLRRHAEYLAELDPDFDIEAYCAKRAKFRGIPRPLEERQLVDGRWVSIREHLTSSGGLVNVRTDITEQKSIEHQLRDREERLKAQSKDLVDLAETLESSRNSAELANHAKSNFLSTMSHEIRTPLNGVLGLAQLLTDTELDDNQRQKVDTILSSGQTLLAILNDVLDMSKIEAGSIELEETAFSLNNLISTITTPFQSLVDEKGLKLIVSNETALSITLNGDPVRLRQILWNLLSNAIKFTNQGHIILTIHSISNAINFDKLVTNTKDHLLYMSVEDTGSGIAPDRVDAIFDAFTQEDDSITRKHGGTGLGLSIVKKLTEMMGGTIQANSEVGSGTIFFVYLPFNAATKDEVDAISLRKGHNGRKAAEPLNVLLVEDNEVNAIIARAFLEKFGHSVNHVENGKLAVEAVKDNWADLILMDIHMPEMNGIEATKAIRLTELGKNLPIIGLTAEAFAERHAHFKEAGMNGVLTKPFSEQQLADMLATHRLEERRSEHRSKEPNDTSGVNHNRIETDDQNEGRQLNERPSAGDEDKLNAFLEQLDSETVSVLLKEAQKSLQNRMEELKQGTLHANPTQIREAAHAIKGASGSMFAMQVSKLATEIEASSTDIDTVHGLMPEFEIAAKDALAWWNRHET